MASTFVDQLDHYRNRLRTSRFAEFMRWWGGELVDVLPPQWRARLIQASRAVVLKLSQTELAVAVEDSGSRHELGVFSLAEDPRLHQQKLREMLVERELLEAPRILLLNESDVLRKEVVLPLAAESGLNQALAYEMDRQTPFRAQDVYFAYRVTRRDREGGHLRVELLVTPREDLADQLEILAARGLPPTAVDVDVDGQPAGVNLLPPELRYRQVDWRSRMNWSLVGVMIVLLAVVMAQSIWLREHQMGEVREAIEEVREEAMRVQQIREQIGDAREAAGFMTARRASAIPTVKLLAEITRLLPDGTYLDRLMISEGAVQMQGKSDNAQRLIELVNASPLLDDAAFRGPTRLDARSGREIFDLTANTTPGGGS